MCEIIILIIILIIKSAIFLCSRPDNSDLIACMVVSKDGGQAQRFLAVDVYQMSLVEPETKRLGWGVVKFAGLLQVCSPETWDSWSKSANCQLAGGAVRLRPSLSGTPRHSTRRRWGQTAPEPRTKLFWQIKKVLASSPNGRNICLFMHGSASNSAQELSLV